MEQYLQQTRKDHEHDLHRLQESIKDLQKLSKNSIPLTEHLEKTASLKAELTNKLTEKKAEVAKLKKKNGKL